MLAIFAKQSTRKTEELDEPVVAITKVRLAGLEAAT
jgi:hypothetical protein